MGVRFSHPAQTKNKVFDLCPKHSFGGESKTLSMSPQLLRTKVRRHERCTEPVRFVSHPKFFSGHNSRLVATRLGRDPTSLFCLLAEHSCGLHKSKKSRAGGMFLSFVHPEGFEPPTTVPKTVVISISLRVQ